MGNPIQYCNTDNPSQMGGGGLATTKGCLSQQPIVFINPSGLIKTGKPLWYAPRGVPQREG